MLLLFRRIKVTLVRYILVQVIAYILEMSFFMVQIKWGLAGLIFSNINAKIVAGVFAFFIHRRYTFKSNLFEPARRQAIKYFLLLALNIPVSSATLTLTLLWIQQPEIAKFISDIACFLFTYTVSKKLVFVRAEDEGVCTQQDPRSCTF